MIRNTRASMIARLALLAALGVTLGAQSSCSNQDGEGKLTVGDPGPGKGTHSGPTFSVTLSLEDSSGTVKSRFARGELITFELTVLNRTNAPVHLQLPTLGGNQDFQVFEPGSGTALWDWVANKTFATAITDVTFPPGGTQVFRGTWDQVKLDGVMLERGTYEAFGRFSAIPGQGPALTDDDTRSPRVAFRID